MVVAEFEAAVEHWIHQPINTVAMHTAIASYILNADEKPEVATVIYHY